MNFYEFCQEMFGDETVFIRISTIRENCYTVFLGNSIILYLDCDFLNLKNITYIAYRYQPTYLVGTSMNALEIWPDESIRMVFNSSGKQRVIKGGHGDYKFIDERGNNQNLNADQNKHVDIMIKSIIAYQMLVSAKRGIT